VSTATGDTWLAATMFANCTGRMKVIMGTICYPMHSAQPLRFEACTTTNTVCCMVQTADATTVLAYASRMLPPGQSGIHKAQLCWLVGCW
jgi:hypothetical protein